MKTKHFVYLTLLSAMAITLNIMESILIGPIFMSLRIGLANIRKLAQIYKGDMEAGEMDGTFRIRIRLEISPVLQNSSEISP